MSKNDVRPSTLGGIKWLARSLKIKPRQWVRFTPLPTCMAEDGFRLVAVAYSRLAARGSRLAVCPLLTRSGRSQRLDELPVCSGSGRFKTEACASSRESLKGSWNVGQTAADRFCMMMLRALT
jgi:hypothetical protein